MNDAHDNAETDNQMTERRKAYERVQNALVHELRQNPPAVLAAGIEALIEATMEGNPYIDTPKEILTAALNTLEDDWAMTRVLALAALETATGTL